jgi:DNA polymerase-4
VILYLRVVPGFGIAAEERARPELRSHPLVIGGLPQQRGIVREANLTAQRCGIRAGMTLAQAHQYCPDGVFLLPDLPRYDALWEEICSILSAFTPLVQPLEIGHAVCDLSGCERRWRDTWDAASEIASHVRQCGITPWLGVASNRLVAELASAAVGPDGITVIEEGQERLFLADLPLTSLPDIDPRLALTFQVLGLRTIGQFADLPASAVRQRFGPAGEKLHRYARGTDSRPVIPPPDRVVVTARYECEDGSVEEAIAAIHRLAEICAEELRRRHLAGRMISLTLSPLTSQPHPPRRGEGETASPSLLPSPLEGEGLGVRGKQTPELPIPYRIHSMLPQPGNPDSNAVERATTTEFLVQDMPLTKQARVSASHPCTGSRLTAHGSQLTARSATRMPVDTVSPIAERAQHLLLQLWPHVGTGTEPCPPHRLEAIKLEIAEFEPPSQLSFPELDRIDQAGALRGMDSVRLQALRQQEQVLAARYGDASFRYVTHIDPTSILTERRFRWTTGLPPMMKQRSDRQPRYGRRETAATGRRPS